MTQMDIPLTPLRRKKIPKKRAQIGNPAALWPPILSGKRLVVRQKRQAFPYRHIYLAKNIARREYALGNITALEAI